MVSSRATEIAIKWPSWMAFVHPSISLAYQIEYKLNEFHGNSSWKSGPAYNDTDKSMELGRVTGLRHNSFYEFRVVPVVRINKQEIRGGASPTSVTFRTKCHGQTSFALLLKCDLIRTSECVIIHHKDVGNSNWLLKSIIRRIMFFLV